MKVVQFRERFSTLSETFIYDTVREMDRQGVETHVVTHHRCNEEDRPFENVHVVPTPSPGILARLWYRVAEPLGLSKGVETYKRSVVHSRLKQVLMDLKPDVVHAQFGPAGVIIAPVASSMGIPLVVTFHGYDVTVLPCEKKVRDRYRRLFEKADALIGVSDHNSTILKELGAPEEKVQTIHNGTRLDQFSCSNPSERFDGRNVWLLHVGRLVEKKAPIDLINAFSLARKKVNGNVDLHLRIAGDGPLREQMLSRIEELQLENRVDYVGEVPHEEVRQLMEQTHVYTQHCKTASNGDKEGQGVTFIEAQASGLPVVSTRSGGVPSVVVDGRTGYLVAEGDTEAMAKRIAHLACNPEKWEHMGRAGRQRVQKHFNLERQVEKLISLYRKVVEKHFA